MDQKDGNNEQDKVQAVTKVERGNKRGLVTRYMNKLTRYAVEEDEVAIKETMDKLRNAFVDFENFHIRYHSRLEEPEEIEQSDNYFFQAEQEYINSLKDAKDWLKGFMRMKSPPQQTVQASDTHDMYRLINLPKVELEPFDGNPLKYHSFIATLTK